MIRYRTVSEVTKDRRVGKSLAEVFDSLIAYPEVWLDLGLETPFSILSGYQEGDFIDTTTESWLQFSHKQKTTLAKAYQIWLSEQFGLKEVVKKAPEMEILDLVLIPPMKFTMGRDLTWKWGPSNWRFPNEADAQDLTPSRVTIPYPFWISKTPVTQKQWKKHFRRFNSHFMVRHEDLPVETVSWYNVNRFCRELKLRLPSEEEWVLAYKCGSNSHFYFGGNSAILGDYAWYFDNSNNITQPVGQKLPNAWGLYDLSGNVWEWTSTKGAENTMITKGGSFEDADDGCAVDSINPLDPDDQDFNIGFRVALSFFNHEE